ncbi:hypothetical protein [Rhizobium sp. FY34]|uniref:hypothetical protein n=1 Tax=Rhizobium sp. FY34 TaxID=2562309 RepID=UPI0010C0DDEF|nr:hypothetical protein [Rhizobium sp. FY34]
MSSDTYGPIEIFRAGTFQPMAGQTATITEGELQRIAESYDVENHPAPIVIGHPHIDAPAYGWVDRLYVEGGKLKATIKDVVAQFAELVKEGRYKKVSISLHLPDSSANPKPGDVYLKHVGFLGAAAPAVPGLKPVQFAGSEGASLCFSQPAPHTVLSFAEHDELSRLRRLVAGQKVETLVNEGKVLPIFKDELMQFAASLDDREAVSFADSGDATRRDWFMSYLERQPKVVSFGALDLGPMPDETRPSMPNVPDGYRIDPSQVELFHRARQIEREKGVSFVDAVSMAQER